MRRVLVLGSSGAGKSTFARRLGAITGLPVIHLDQLCWQPGWRRTPSDVYLANLRSVVDADQWIIDGNNASTLDLRLPRADRIILIERSRLACLGRVGRRVIRSYGTVRPDMPRVVLRKLIWSSSSTSGPLLSSNGCRRCRRFRPSRAVPQMGERLP